MGADHFCSVALCCQSAYNNFSIQIFLPQTFYDKFILLAPMQTIVKIAYSFATIICLLHEKVDECLFSDKQQERNQKDWRMIESRVTITISKICRNQTHR